MKESMYTFSDSIYPVVAINFYIHGIVGDYCFMSIYLHTFKYSGCARAAPSLDMDEKTPFLCKHSKHAITDSGCYPVI